MRSKKIGIWMDHKNAYVIEFTKDAVRVKKIDSAFNHQVKEASLDRGEKKMHSKEQHQQTEYYNGIGKVIHQYEFVVPISPTNAKTAICNALIANRKRAFCQAVFPTELDGSPLPIAHQTSAPNIRC